MDKDKFQCANVEKFQCKSVEETARKEVEGFRKYIF